MNRMPTSPSGTPVAGMADQLVGGSPAIGMSPNMVGSYEVPFKLTVIVTALPQLFAMKMAKQGGAMAGMKEGVGTTKSQPMVPLATAAASHAATHLPPAQPWSGGHVSTTTPALFTTLWRSPLH